MAEKTIQERLRECRDAFSYIDAEYKSELKRRCAVEIELDRLTAQLKEAREALHCIASIPIEDFGKEGKPNYPLAGWNGVVLHVRDVLRARAALAATEPKP